MEWRMLAILRISSSSKAISQVTPFTGRVPLHPGEAVLLSIPVTSNASYQSIRLNQHLPLAAAPRQVGSQGMGMRGQWREVTSWRGGRKTGEKELVRRGRQKASCTILVGSFCICMLRCLSQSGGWWVGEPAQGIYTQGACDDILCGAEIRDPAPYATDAGDIGWV